MEANQETIAALAQYLQQTMNQEKAIRKQAEDFLMQNEHVAGYAILLLSILDKENIDLNIRQAGAVRFKNFIKKHWCPDTETDIVPEQTRVVIKQNIVTLMVSSHPKIQAQISEVCLPAEHMADGSPTRRSPS
jgi:exportin-2 (importin alpha re-exporter)